MTHYIDIDVWMDEHVDDMIEMIDLDDILDELECYSQTHRVEIGVSLTGDLDDYMETYHEVEMDEDQIKERIQNYVRGLEERIRWLREANRGLDDELKKHTRKEKAMEFYRNAL